MKDSEFRKFYNNWYNLEGERIESLKDLEECQKNKVIKQETMSDGKFVSTIWLGLDHSYNRDEKLIFETMIFNNNEDFEDLYCDRYSTKEMALIGHNRAVEFALGHSDDMNQTNIGDGNID